MANKQNTYKVIDLFCGAGGFSQGFQQNGFDVCYGIDFWKDATVTYKHNFPNAVVDNKNIEDVTASDILHDTGLKKGDIDVIIGGPPCQGFSLSGFRFIDDPRNRLYKSYVRLAKDLQPKIIVMENVPGLISLFEGTFKKQVIEDFEKVGYKVWCKILDADEYGVPQDRKRVFFVGLNRKYFSSDILYEYPHPITGADTGVPMLTCADAISDLDFIPDDHAMPEKIDYKIPPQNDYQRKMRNGSTVVLNHVATIHKQKTKDIIAMVPDGGNYKDLPKELWSTRKVHIAWTRMNSHKPCFTIDTGHNHQFHYKENRVPTVRESARIQSFPDTFEFLGTKTSQLRQVGNAVPPLLAEAIAGSIRNVLQYAQS